MEVCVYKILNVEQKQNTSLASLSFKDMGKRKK